MITRLISHFDVAWHDEKKRTADQNQRLFQDWSRIIDLGSHRRIGHLMA
jgi:hypothetical protein